MSTIALFIFYWFFRNAAVLNNSSLFSQLPHAQSLKILTCKNSQQIVFSEQDYVGKMSGFHWKMCLFLKIREYLLKMAGNCLKIFPEKERKRLDGRSTHLESAASSHRKHEREGWGIPLILRMSTRAGKFCKREETSNQKIYKGGIVSAKLVLLVAHINCKFPYIVVGSNWLSLVFPVFVRQTLWHSFHLVYAGFVFSPHFFWAVDVLAENLTCFSSCSLCLQKPQQSWLASPAASKIWLFCENPW
jgi:hypothetical protein